MATSLRGDDVISDVIKNAVFRQRRTFNKRFSIAERICEQKLESSLINLFRKKMINWVLLGIVDIAQLDHAVIVQFGVTRSWYLNVR